MTEPIAEAGWVAPLWLRMEWRLTLLLLTLALFAFLSKTLWFIVVSAAAIVGLGVVFVRTAEYEPYMLDLFVNTRSLGTDTCQRLADLNSSTGSLPKANRY